LQLTTATSRVATQPVGGVGVAANISVDPASVQSIASAYTVSGVTVGSNGALYVADSGAGQLLKMSTGGGSVQVLATGLKNPGQIGVDGAGNVYVADAGNNRVVKVTAATGTAGTVGGGLQQPQGIAVDPAGNVYVADTGNNRVVQITPLGGQLVMPTSGLAGPTKLAYDTAGTLYVADAGNARVVAQPLTSEQSVVNLGTSVVTPQGLAVDAAGDLYVADAASGQVLEFAPGVTNAEALVTALTGPKGLAVDGNGTLYVADASSGGVLVANRHNPSSSFPNTNLNTTNSTQLNVANTGNASMLFHGSSFATATGNTAPFSVTSASTNGCVLGVAIGPGSQCALNAGFSPTATGTYSETATFTTNAANSGQALLSGVAVFLVSTTSTLTITQPTTSTIYYAQAVTVSLNVAAASNAGSAPTGSVQFSVDGKKQAAQSLPASGTLTLTINPAVGTHVVSVLYSGDALYASSSSSVSFTVQKAATTTALSITPGSTSTPYLKLTATVSSTTAGGETGTVTFSAGGTQVGSANVGTNGMATLTTSTIAYSSYSFVASYSGDSNFNASTSAAVVPPGQVLVQPGGTTLTVPQGSVGTLSATLTPLFNYSGTLTPSCSGLPANSVCRFSPVSLSFTSPVSGAQPVSQTLSVLVYTNVDANLAGIGGRTAGWVMALLSLMGAMAWCGRRLRRNVALALVLAACLWSTAGCSSASTSNANTLVTPQGTSTVTVTLTDTAGTKQTFSFTLTVVAPYSFP